MHDDTARIGVDELLNCFAVSHDIAHRVRSGSVVAVLDHLGEVWPHGVGEVVGVVAHAADPGSGGDVDESAVTQDHQ